MKRIASIKWLAAAALVLLGAQSLSAQNQADVFDRNVNITWLGVDYSLVTFIGTPTNTGVAFNAWTVVKKTDDGIVTKDQFINDFTVEWNQLFIDEPKKYNIAKATNRGSINYDIDVCIKANKKITRDFFSNNPSDYHTKTEADVINAVKNYDFGNAQGLGMMFFVEGMDKGTTEEGIWVTFVDIKTKTVLLTKYIESKAQGSGFRNYWAKPMYVLLKEMDLSKWR